MADQGRARHDTATIYAVAERAGVSIATVSRVLADSGLVTESTRQKVLGAIDELDYLPSGAARSLAVRYHDTFGLVLPELSGPYYAELLVGFEGRAAELNQSVMLVLAGTREDRHQAVRALASRVDGIAVLGSATANVGRATKPLVVIAGPAGPGIEAIAAENTESARDLTEHLLQHGRTRLLFVGDPRDAHDVHERHEGFVTAHRDRAMTPAEPVVVKFREEEGAAVAARIIAGELDTDGLVCGNDELALGIMSRLLECGVDVPGDIAVVGWDDVMTSRYVRPALTTVRQPVQRIGALAAERLHQLVTGTAPSAQRQVLPTEVVIRSSCGCPAPGEAPPKPPDQQSPSPPKVRDR